GVLRLWVGYIADVRQNASPVFSRFGFASRRWCNGANTWPTCAVAWNPRSVYRQWPCRELRYLVSQWPMYLA
ncbi:MAG: hypothetical protein NZM42_14630, partial [Gemmatales bacterium]|nr:hypothetical protein [Gemmatales bacterium]